MKSLLILILSTVIAASTNEGECSTLQSAISIRWHLLLIIRVEYRASTKHSIDLETNDSLALY